MSLPSLKQQFAALIAAPSVSCTQPAWDQSNRPVVELLASWLSDLGFACEMQSYQPRQVSICWPPMAAAPVVWCWRATAIPCLSMRRCGRAIRSNSPRRAIVGCGLGVCDMKGFFALVIEAVRSLLDQPFKQPLLILATCDEESSMSGARALAAAGRPLGRAAVIGEPTGLRPIRLHKGIMMERIDILGQSGHSSDPELGPQCAGGHARSHRRAARCCASNGSASIKIRCSTCRSRRLNFGCIHGGDNPNRICGQCSLEFDLRPLPGMDPASAACGDPAKAAAAG